MNSPECFFCGFVNLAGRATCQRCGVSLTAPTKRSHFQHYQPPPDDFWQKWWKMRWAASAAKLGAINLATLGVLGVGAIAGVIVSLVALKKIKQRPDQNSGRGFAIAGLVMSIVSVVLAVPAVIVFFIALPMIRAGQVAINEETAVFCLKRIRVAETSFHNTKKKYGTLEELLAERLIDPGLAKGERDGYKFKVIISSYSSSGSPEFDALASPVDQSSGRRSFLIDETGVIHAAEGKYGDASSSDPPLPERRVGQSD